MRRIFAFLILVVLTCVPSFARAEEYVHADWPNLMRTMIRFNALDLSDKNLLDDYSIVTECALYNRFYTDDFKWQQVRQAIQESVKMNMASYPTSYHYDMTMELDRYDFASKLFRFKPQWMINNVNTFGIYSVDGGGCGASDVKNMPRVFRAVINVPVSMEGIPLAEKDAQALLVHMKDVQNDKRIVFARFNLRIVYIAPWKEIPPSKKNDSEAHYQQSDTVAGNGVRLDARLDSISFYEDPERTKLIFQY